MKRNLAAIALLLGACSVQDRTSVEILGRAAPDNVTTCNFAPSGEFLLGAGVLDVSLQRHYSTAVYVTNNLVDPKSLAPEAVTAAKDWLPSATRVRVNPQEYVDRFGANPALLPVTMGDAIVPIAGPRAAAAGGQTSEVLDLIPTTMGDAIATALGGAATRRIVLGVTLEGQTNDGAKIDSGEWYLPIDVCNGCLNVTLTCQTGQVPVPGSCFGFGQDAPAKCGTP